MKQNIYLSLAKINCENISFLFYLIYQFKNQEKSFIKTTSFWIPHEMKSDYVTILDQYSGVITVTGTEWLYSQQIEAYSVLLHNQTIKLVWVYNHWLVHLSDTVGLA